MSCTISYGPDEMPAMIEWFERHWDEYVGVSFLFRVNPGARAEELGYAYLPQEVVTEEEYMAYVSKLETVDIAASDSDDVEGTGCTMGGCPIR